MDFDEAIELADSAWELMGYSPKTRHKYLLQARQMARSLQKPLSSVTTDDLKRYLLRMKHAKSLSNSTVYSHVNAIKAFFKVLLDNGVIASQPAEGLPVPRRQRKLPTYLTNEELSALLRVSRSNLRDHCLLEFMYATGVRVSEAVDMMVDSVNLAERTAFVRMGKGGKDRLVIMSQHAATELEQYLKKRYPPSPYLFTNRWGKKLTPRYVEKMIKRYADKAGIRKKVTPHVLRHTFATHMLESKVDIRAIQELLGHSSLATTQVYTHVTPERLKRLVGRHPREALEDQAS